MRVTTNGTILRDLQASLRQRGYQALPGTVGDFIGALQALGVTLNDEIGSIEVGVSATGTGRIVVERDEHGFIEIREV